MKWRVTYTNGKYIDINAPTPNSARELAGRNLHLRKEVASIKRVTKDDEIRRLTYVVIDPIEKDFKGHLLNKRWQWKPSWAPHVRFEGGLLRCVEYVIRNSRNDIDHIRAKSGKGRLRYLTEAEKTKAYKRVFPDIYGG